MKLIRPTAVDDDVLVSSSVAEDDFPIWSSGATYALATRVVRGHRIWESVQAGNLSRDPLTAPPGWWLDVGPTNRWAMFDGVVGTSTEAALSMSVTLAPGRIDSLALLEVDAASVTVEMVAQSITVYSRTISMIDNSQIANWQAWFFEPTNMASYVYVHDLPIYGDGELTITFERPTGNVRCGVAVLGLASDLGDVLASPTIGINDYSRKETDDFGVTTLVRRSWAKRMNVRLVLPAKQVDRVQSVLASVRAMPIVWVGSDRYAAMLIYGFYRDFEIDIAYAATAYATLTIEGLI